MTTATSIANPNLVLIKYWGNNDKSSSTRFSTIMMIEPPGSGPLDAPGDLHTARGHMADQKSGARHQAKAVHYGPKLMTG
jgi:hypothetical protein